MQISGQNFRSMDVLRPSLAASSALLGSTRRVPSSNTIVGMMRLPSLRRINQLFRCRILLDVDPGIRDLVIAEEGFRAAAVRTPKGAIHCQQGFGHGQDTTWARGGGMMPPLKFAPIVVQLEYNRLRSPTGLREHSHPEGNQAVRHARLSRSLPCPSLESPHARNPARPVACA